MTSSSSSSTSMVPSSSAGFVLTLDQNVSREVRARVLDLQKKTTRAFTATWLSVGTAVAANAALWVLEPWLIVLGGYTALFTLPIVPVVWLYRRKASLAAALLNQDRDVAFVGPDGLVFFGDDGFFLEKAGGWKPYGIRDSFEARRFDDVEYIAHDRKLVLSSSAGYSVNIRVPAGWSDVDTERVRVKLEAFTW
jgi:hypothetical protein